MPEYLTPGVYVEEVSFRAPSIEGVGTSTTGFAGVTLTGPTGTLPATASSPNPNPSQDTTPELLTSFGDFQNIYGGYDNLALPLNSTGVNNVNYMAMAVKAFFDNGGSQLYVSRVFQPGASANGGFAASGVPSKTNVTVAARFPGASGNQSVGVKLKATRTQNVASLPSGSLVASAANTAQLANAVGTTDQQITLSAPLPWGAPTGAPLTILIDNETMTVSKTDATGTVLSVSRAAAPATHAAGAVVLGQVGYLFSALGGGVTSLTISAVPTAAATPTTTPAPGPTVTGTTPTTTTPAPAPKASRPPNGIPAFLQIDPGGANSEIMTVTQVDATGTVVTVTRGSTTGYAYPECGSLCAHRAIHQRIFELIYKLVPRREHGAAGECGRTIRIDHAGDCLDGRRIACRIRRAGLRSGAPLLSGHGAGGDTAPAYRCVAESGGLQYRTELDAHRPVCGDLLQLGGTWRERHPDLYADRR